METGKTNWITIPVGVLFILLLIVSLALGGGVISSRAARQAQGLDAQLGLRFLSPLPADPKQGNQLDALVVSPEKLTGMGMGALKRGDRVTLIKGANDEFSVKFNKQNMRLRQTNDGSVRFVVLEKPRELQNNKLSREIE